MKDARYLIRVANAAAHSSVDAAALLQDVRQRILPLEMRAINLRVSSRALEFDLFLPSEKSPEPALAALESLGSVLTCKRLDVPPPPIVPETIVQEARHLFNEERFWEVHEVLEDLWRGQSGDEKQWVQGLILAAAALVHRQKNENRVIVSMLEDALHRLKTAPPAYHGWNIAEFRPALEMLRDFPNAALPTV